MILQPTSLTRFDEACKLRLWRTWGMQSQKIPPWPSFDWYTICHQWAKYGGTCTRLPAHKMTRAWKSYLMDGKELTIIWHVKETTVNKKKLNRHMTSHAVTTRRQNVAQKIDLIYCSNLLILIFTLIWLLTTIYQIWQK